MQAQQLPQADQNFPRLRLGISSCLLGQEVRYDGGHKRDRFITDALSRFSDFVPVCPELAAGLGVPRPPVQLVGSPGGVIRALGVRDETLDVTRELEQASSQAMPSLAGLDGYILKKDSPSCGMERVKLYARHNQAPKRQGTGLYAAILMQTYPLLPIEEEGRLNDPVLRENFINRTYAWQAWRQLQQKGLNKSRLIAFHSSCKYLVMAHSQASYKRLGTLLSDLTARPLEEIAGAYIGELMTTLSRRVNPARHVNVLQHIMGYLKSSIDGGDKAELLAALESYRRREVPLVVPVTLLRHYFRRHPDPYMAAQRYLHPHPDGLALRSHI